MIDQSKQAFTAGAGEIIMKQEIWIDVDEDTKQHDVEIHLQGKDIFEILEGLEIIKERIRRDNGLFWENI